jgi:acyl dehydratase
MNVRREDPRVVDTSLMGTPLAPSTVVLERSPVSTFARAVKSTSSVYQDATAAKAAGFDAVPAPPTYTFAAGLHGTFPELQERTDAPPNPAMAVIGKLMQTGGMVLHGEQAFTYHAPMLSGDTLTTSGRVSDISEKTSSSGSVMTFVSTETEFRNQRGELVVTSVMTLIHRA